MEIAMLHITTRKWFLTTATSDAANSSHEAPVSELEDDFFFFTRHIQCTCCSAANILSTYTSSTSASLDDLHGYPLLKNICIELNNALPQFLQVQPASVCLV